MAFVRKSDGRSEQFDVEKVKKVIAWGSQGLDINPLKLESKFDEFLTDDITTDTIQTNLIYHARMLCTPDDPEFSIVAGRLETMRLWKRTSIGEKSFHYYIKEQVENKVYKHPAIQKWTKNEIIELGKEIDQERDLHHSYGSVLTAMHKYLLPNECLQQLHMTNAMIIASVEKKENRLFWAKKIYHALSRRKISLATPWLSNLRSNSNISSCFIIGVDDDLESIFDNVKNAAMISKLGGGLGIDMSLVRAFGSEINGVKGASKGIPSWTKIFNDTAVAVDQGGKRAGAFTVHTPIWHRDIEDFLGIQLENKDPRLQSFDIFPQVGLYDLFMKEVQKDDGGTWHTFCPHEVKTVMGFELAGIFGKDFNQAYRKCITAYNKGKLEIVGVYNAKGLLKEMMKSQIETGMPYIAFLDRINEMNPNSHDGYIPCVNLCTESFSNVVADELTHTCNLASIVVGRIDSDEEMVDMARLCTRILDNGISLTRTPIESASKHNERYRTIGVGIQGLHDYIARWGLTWKSEKEITKVAELIEFGCVTESVQLAQEYSSYPAFKGSKWDTGELINNFKRHSVSDVDWAGLQALINKYGIRNSQMTSPAPNTSTANFMDACAGCIPAYSAFYTEDNASGKFTVYGMYLKENPMSYENTAPRQNQVDLTKVVGWLQKFVDTGVSFDYIFDHNKGFKAVDLYDTIISAWKQGTKAIYYIRSIKVGDTIDDVIGIESACVGCSG